MSVNISLKRTPTGRFIKYFSTYHNYFLNACMHACLYLKWNYAGILETVLIYSDVQFDITTCKCDLRMLNLTCKHLQLYINLYSYRELQWFIPGSKNTR